MADKMKSECQPTYPASLMPEFMGAKPPVDHDKSYNLGNERRSYFRNYRNEVLSRFLIQPNEWDVQRTSYSPKSHPVSSNSVRKLDRALAVPSNNIAFVDAQRMCEVDDFYKTVQLHREQYRDHRGLLHPLKYFRRDEYSFPCPGSLLPAYFPKCRETYTAYKASPVLPLTYERATKSSNLPEFAIPGIYARGNCIAYKR